MLLPAIFLIFDDKIELFDCFSSSDVRIIPSLGTVCLDIAYPIVKVAECAARFPHGVQFSGTLDSLFQGVQYTLVQVMNDYVYGTTTQMCFLCVSAAGGVQCNTLDQTNRVVIWVEGQTHKAQIDIKSIRIDRLQDTCLTGVRSIFDDDSICWKMWLSDAMQCQTYYLNAGSFSFDKITYQILLNDGTNVREADISPFNYTTTVTFNGSKADIFICQKTPRKLNIQSCYVTSTNLLVRKVHQQVVIDAYMQFYVLSFPETDNSITFAQLTLQENSAKLSLTYNQTDIGPLNAQLDAFGAQITSVLFKLAFSVTNSNEFLEISFERSSFRFGDVLGTQLCTFSTDSTACVSILTRLMGMKQSEYNAFFLTFFLDAHKSPLMEVLKTISVIKYSCIQSASANVYYGSIEITFVPRAGDCTYSNSSIAIELTLTNTTTQDVQVFRDFVHKGDNLVFNDDRFEQFCVAMHSSSDYLLFINLGFDGAFPQRVYFKDTRVMQSMAAYGFIGVVILSILLALLVMFDRRIWYKLQRNKKRLVKRADGEVVEDDL